MTIPSASGMQSLYDNDYTFRYALGLWQGLYLQVCRASMPSGMQRVHCKEYAFRFAERLWQGLLNSGMQRVHGKDYAFIYAERLWQGLGLQVCRRSMKRIIASRYAESLWPGLLNFGKSVIFSEKKFCTQVSGSEGPGQKLCLQVCRASVARIMPSGLQSVYGK